MDIPHCFERGSVVHDLENTEKCQAIRELIQRSSAFSSVEDIGRFERSVLNREDIQSTGLGRGVALAHGNTPGVERPTVALGISHEGIDYGSVDAEPVRLLYIIAAPPDRQTEYLKVLSTLVRLVRNERFRLALLQARSATGAQRIMHEAFYA